VVMVVWSFMDIVMGERMENREKGRKRNGE
jgi:hypothetical protein